MQLQLQEHSLLQMLWWLTSKNQSQHLQGIRWTIQDDRACVRTGSGIKCRRPGIKSSERSTARAERGDRFRESRLARFESRSPILRAVCDD